MLIWGLKVHTEVVAGNIKSSNMACMHDKWTHGSPACLTIIWFFCIFKLQCVTPQCITTTATKPLLVPLYRWLYKKVRYTYVWWILHVTIGHSTSKAINYPLLMYTNLTFDVHPMLLHCVCKCRNIPMQSSQKLTVNGVCLLSLV